MVSSLEIVNNNQISLLFILFRALKYVQFFQAQNNFKWIHWNWLQYTMHSFHFGAFYNC
jgi:hypothetical protein